MALLWEQRTGGRHYEVRSAGRTRRLYTDGVCHSEFNPSRLTTGSIWDLLLLSAFLHPPGTVRRALVLGVGGGTLLLQLRALAGVPEITGVDLSAVHLSIARRFFGLDAQEFRLVEDDAVAWVRRCRERFDLIVDDLFTGTKGEPVRAFPAGREWMELVASRLADGGTLAINFASYAEVRACGWYRGATLRRALPWAFRFTTPRLDNAVGVFTQRPSDPDTLRAHLLAEPRLRRALRERRLNYRVRVLDPADASRRGKTNGHRRA